MFKKVFRDQVKVLYTRSIHPRFIFAQIVPIVSKRSIN